MEQQCMEMGATQLLLSATTSHLLLPSALQEGYGLRHRLAKHPIMGKNYCVKSQSASCSSSKWGHNLSGTELLECIETPGSQTATPMPQPDSVVDEAGRRQNKPRRYSEMNFGQ